MEEGVGCCCCCCLTGGGLYKECEAPADEKGGEVVSSGGLVSAACSC